MEMQKPFRVGLVGAGIGGLAAAIAVARAGADVTVLEAAEELGEVKSPLICLPWEWNCRTVLMESPGFLDWRWHPNDTQCIPAPARMGSR